MEHTRQRINQFVHLGIEADELALSHRRLAGAQQREIDRDVEFAARHRVCDSTIGILPQKMNRRSIALPFLLIVFCGCQKKVTVIHIDNGWDRDYAANACEGYREAHYGVGCIDPPEQMAADLRSRFASAVLQSRACKDVVVSSTPVTEKDLESGWSLSFNVAIDGGEIDYPNSEWQIIDNQTHSRFSEGSLRDAVESATRICIVATGRGGSVSNDQSSR
jgi:hypothetical protein